MAALAGKVFLGFALGIFIFAGGASGATNVSSCGITITSPDVYVLNQSINGSSTCITIESSDVIFDGQGYTIDGADNSSTYGVYAYNASATLTNVTVKNLVVTDWGHGVHYYNVTNGSIEDNNASSNNYGIWLNWSGINTVDNNEVTNNSKTGIYINSGGNNTVSNNNISNNNQGASSGEAGLYLSNSDNNTFFSNYMSNNPIQGVRLDGSSNNTFDNDSIIFNCGGERGVYMTNSDSNTFKNSNISFNTGHGIEMSGSDYNSFLNNNIDSNGQVGSGRGGIYMTSSDYNTISGGTVNNNNAKGVYIYQSSNVTVTGVEIHDNTGAGIHDKAVVETYQNFSYNNLSGNSYGIYMDTEDNCTITGNRIWNSASYGIYLTNFSPVSPNTIYNNWLNNTNNSYDDGTNNWNTTVTAGTNIVGGPYIGGNFWTHPNGTGISEDCTDTDFDGICDADYNITGGSNLDHLPLATYTGPPPTIIPILPVESQTILNSTVTFVFFSVDESSASLYYNLTIDGVVNLTNQSAVSGENESITVNGLSDGSHNWSIAIRDGDGNANTSETRNFTVLIQWDIPDVIVPSIPNTTNGSGIVDLSARGVPQAIIEQTGVTGYEYLITTNGSTPVVNLSVNVFIEAPPGVSTITNESAIPDFYYQIEVNDSTWFDNVTMIQLKIYYNISNIDMPSGVTEDSLRPSRYTNNSWKRLDCSEFGGCTATLADDTELYAAGVVTSLQSATPYVWANLSNFSVYGIGGAVYGVGGTVQATGGGGGGYKPAVVVLANSIDYSRSIHFFDFLRSKRIEVIHVSPGNFSKYKSRRFIVILGGPDAYDGVGDIAREALYEKEQTFLRMPGNCGVYVKANVWRTDQVGQVVWVIAGNDRELTGQEVLDNQADVADRIKYHPAT